VKVSTIASIGVLAAGVLVAGGMVLGRHTSGRRPIVGPGPARAGLGGPMADDGARGGAPADADRPESPTGPEGRVWPGQGFAGPGFPGPWGANAPAMPPLGGGQAGGPGGGPSANGPAATDAPMGRGFGPPGNAGAPGRPGARPQGSGDRPAGGAPGSMGARNRPGGGAPGGMGARAPTEAPAGPWAAWGGGWSGPPQGPAEAGAPGMAWGNPFAGPGGGWPVAAGGSARRAATGDPMYGVLAGIQRQLDLLASAAEDLDNASVAMREKNQDQVKEILHRGAGKLAKVSEAWREVTQGLRAGGPPSGWVGQAPVPWGQGGGPMAYAGPAGPQPSPWRWPAAAPGRVWQPGPASPEAPSPDQGALDPDQGVESGPDDVFAPVIVPDEEPTAAAERQGLEEEVRMRFRLLEAPYLQLREYGVEMPEVNELLQACREALSAGSLRDAALSFNAAAELMEQLLAAAEEEAPPS